MSQQEAQLRLTVVALVSILQAYLREVLEEKGDRLGNSWEELTDIERRYVGVQSLRRISGFFAEDADSELKESKKVDALRVALQDCATWQNRPSTLSASPYRQKLDGFLQNNGSNVLDRIVSRYSKCELSFFDWLNKGFPRYRGLSDVLDIIIATRNDVAHGTFVRRVTIHDVREFRVLIYRMIMMMETYILARADGSAPLDPPHAAIAERAYFISLKRGNGGEDHLDHWLTAERELRY